MTEPRQRKPAAWAPEPLDTPTGEAGASNSDRELEITHTDCRACGAAVSGLNGRYACGVCGWVNAWSEGHSALPTAADDSGPHAPKD
ncbi:hypothetical protein ACF068_30670 [Streptomyces sp. NPDC016309]|uniref:hypothetical protein n=1 Tax=Streptomyces sp. NPDC016309 TaxID=3364965 RepID=UPI00370280A7